MSDTVLQYVPSDPDWRPTAESAERARAQIANFLPEAKPVEFRFTEKIEFFHGGENWSGVNCPACGADLEDWWSDTMGAAHAHAFANLSATPPCCGKPTSLDALSYGWPVAFGKFVLEAWNPNVRDTTLEQDTAIGDSLGAQLRKVWVRI